MAIVGSLHGHALQSILHRLRKLYPPDPSQSTQKFLLFHSRYLAHVFAETGNIFRKLMLRPDLSQDREYRVPVVRLYPTEKPLVFNF